MTPAVFLDRDGVLNRALVRNAKPYAPRNLGELEILPGVAAACRALRSAGYLLFAVSNQPDVARGLVTRQAVEAINAAIQRQILLNGFFVCYHADEDNCACRKPKPGLLLEAARVHALDLSRSFLVGDRWKDIEAGHRARCKTVFIDYGYCEVGPCKPDLTARSLAEAAAWILSHPISRSAYDEVYRNVAG